MCVVCVCFLPIHSGHHIRWPYQPGSHRRKVTQDFSSSFGGACLNVSLREEGFSHSFPSSAVKSDFCFYFLFSSEKNSVYRDRTHVPTCQKVTRLPLSYRGDYYSKKKQIALRPSAQYYDLIIAMVWVCFFVCTNRRRKVD